MVLVNYLFVASATDYTFTTMSDSNKVYEQSDNFLEILMEHFDNRLDAFEENLGVMIDIKLQPIDYRLKNVESDVKLIKAVVTAQSSNLKVHDARFTDIEESMA